MKILVPTDFSVCADEALRYALNLAEKLSAKVTLVHAYVVPIYPTPEGSALIPDPMAVEDSLIRAQQALSETAQRMARPTLPVETRVVEGNAAQSVVQIAEDEHFDMIVMGTHGRTGIKHLLLGSVAERIVRTAPCPVLTVRLKQPVHHLAASVPVI